MEHCETPEQVAKRLGYNRARGYWIDGSGLIGIRHRGLVNWFRYDWRKKRYVNTGSTLRPKQDWEPPNTVTYRKFNDT